MQDLTNNLLKAGQSAFDFQVPHIYQPGGDVEWILKKAKNKKDKDKKKILTAMLAAHLNPLLALDDIVTVDNVQKRYAGNWWIWEIEDTIGSDGGITEITMGRNHFTKKEDPTDKNPTVNTSKGPAQEQTSTKTVENIFQQKDGKFIKERTTITPGTVIQPR